MPNDVRSPAKAKTSVVKKTLALLGTLWLFLGNLERFIGWISGSVWKETTEANDTMKEFFELIPLIGDPDAQAVMITGGIMLLSVAFGLVVFGDQRNNVASTAAGPDVGNILPNTKQALLSLAEQIENSVSVRFCNLEEMDLGFDNQKSGDFAIINDGLMQKAIFRLNEHKWSYVGQTAISTVMLSPEESLEVSKRLEKGQKYVVQGGEPTYVSKNPRWFVEPNIGCLVEMLPEDDVDTTAKHALIDQNESTVWGHLRPSLRGAIIALLNGDQVKNFDRCSKNGPEVTKAFLKNLVITLSENDLRTSPSQ